MKDVIVFIVLCLSMLGLMYLFYNKGRRDEAFRELYLCYDCGDFREDSLANLCRDCQRKLWGEMEQG
jgi:hypothetical protein